MSLFGGQYLFNKSVINLEIICGSLSCPGLIIAGASVDVIIILLLFYILVLRILN